MRWFVIFQIVLNTIIFVAIRRHIMLKIESMLRKFGKGMGKKVWIK